MGSAYERPAAKGLLCKRPSRRDGDRFVTTVWRLFRDDWGAGLCVGGQRRLMESDRARSSGGVVGGGPDFAMIRVVLPFHLRTLARVDGEVQVEVQSPVTVRSIIDALETRYPVLRGTIRDHITLK